MCINCSPDRDDEDDYEEDYEDEEPDMDERWSAFYDHIEYFDYELASIAGASLTDVEDYEPSVEYLKAVRDAFKSDFETAIDTDGVLDAKRRLERRDEWRANAENSLPDTHDVMVAAVQLGVYRGMTGAPNIEQAFRAGLIDLGIALQETFIQQAQQYEDANYSVGGIE